MTDRMVEITISIRVREASPAMDALLELARAATAWFDANTPQAASGPPQSRTVDLTTTRAAPKQAGVVGRPPVAPQDLASPLDDPPFRAAKGVGGAGAAAPAGGTTPVPPPLPPPQETPFTPPREDLLRRKYRGGDAIEHITADLNALAGPPIGPAQVVVWVGRLGLRRAPGYGDNPSPSPPPPAQAPLVPLRPKPTPAPSVLDRSSGSMTPERLGIFVDMWEAGDHEAAVLGRMNALPGPRLEFGTLAALAQRYNLKRPIKKRDEAAPIIAERQLGEEAPGADLMDWPSAMIWASRNGVKLSQGASRALARLQINTRREELSLPLWTIIEARGEVDALPPPELGAHYGEAPK